MIDRIIDIPKNHSFFLFGPRQTGKSTLLKTSLSREYALYYDLLDPREYRRLKEHPERFMEEVQTRSERFTHVLVDEIQQVPELLDTVHAMMEGENSPYFCMSGSSARKLKRGKANLLAGRAWNYNLFPLTHSELGKDFSLTKALDVGTLPRAYLTNRMETIEMLYAYVDTYLKEEIEQEAMVRNISGFLRFLSLAGNENGNIINFSVIGRQAGIASNTVKEYFRILEDTLLGFFLFPYTSQRRQLAKHPKFYFFDTGVQRAVNGTLESVILEGTSEFGRAFEHFIILEIMRLASYRRARHRFFFYRTDGGAEVDLIVETAKRKTYAIEIKASTDPHSSSLRGLQSFKEIQTDAELICACLTTKRRKFRDITIMPWQELFEMVL